MLLKLFLILVLVIVILSIVSRLFFPRRDGPAPGRPTGRSITRTLTVRIALSLLVFAVLVLGYHWGWNSTWAPGQR